MVKTIIFLLAFSSSAAFGAISITPASPTPSETITIRVETPFGSSTNLTSASINRVGNTFTIQQNVNIACQLPQSTIVSSEFQVGPLAAGTYDVTANIVFTGLPPSLCGPPPITQTTSFTVASVTSNVPALDARGFLLLAVAIAMSAVVVLRR